MKSIFVKAIFIGISIIIILLLFELALRLSTDSTFLQGNFGNKKYPWLLYDPILGWKNQAGFKNNLVEINSHGFLGKEVSLEKPPGVIRIVSLGGSITFGIWESLPGLIDIDSYTNTLTERFQSEGSDNIEVINAGVIGYSSSNGLRFLMTKVLELKPDIITVKFGFNDFSRIQNVNSHIREPLNKISRWVLYKFDNLRVVQLGAHIGQRLKAGQHESKEHNVTEEEFRKNLKRIVNEAQERDIRILFIDSPLSGQKTLPLREDKFFREYTGASSIEDMRETHNKYQSILKSIAVQQGVPILETKDQFEGSDKSLYAKNDLIHPNQRGSQLIEEMLYEKIKELGWLTRM